MTIEVECSTLEAVLEEALGREGDLSFDLLKLDCEGAEHEILLSTPLPALRKIRRIALEYHHAPHLGPRPVESVARRLEEAGHRVERIPSRKAPDRGHIFSERL